VPRRRAGCLRTLAIFALAGFVALNGLAWIQAWAATHFVPDGQPLEQLLTLPLPARLWALASGVKIPRPQNRQTPRDHNLPYETYQISLPNGEVLEGWFVPHPQSRGVIIMFTGYAGVKDGLLTPAATVYQLGWSSFLVDFRGTGGSSGNDTTLGMREAQDVAAAFAYARESWPGQPIVLYGVSMGSAAILRAVAVEGVRPAGLILEGAFDRLLTTTRHRFDAVGAPASPAAALLLFWGSLQLGYNGFSHNPAEYAASVECPTLLMHGERDTWVTPAETRAIFERLRGPRQIVQIPGVGHEMPFVYHEPGLWRESVAQLLAQVAPDGLPASGSQITTAALNLRAAPGIDEPIIVVLEAGQS
jgi:alpha-beta hydrolase superfamily lysophospholipase